MGFVEERVESWDGRMNVGYITFNSEGEFTEVLCPTDHGTEQNVSETLGRVQNVIKLNILENRPLSETMSDVDAHSFHDLSQAVEELSLADVLSMVDLE